MKKICLLLTFFLFFFTSFSQEDCIANSSLQPCCNDIISTGFPDPSNSEYPALTNQFNWLNGGPGLNTISVSTLGNLSQINHPFLYEIPDYNWFSNYRSSFNFDIDTHNMHPRYGWELMHMSFGLGLFNSGTPQTGGGVYGTYLMFYNKYTGKLRLFTSPSSGNSKSNEVSVDLSIPVHPLSSNHYHSATFNSYNIKQLALDNKSNVNFVKGQMNTVALKEWTLTDFELSYDPCICNHQSRFVFKFTERNFSYANISSNLIGNYQPLTDYSGRISQNYLLHSIWQTGSFLNEEINSGLITVNPNAYRGNNNLIDLAEVIDFSGSSKKGVLSDIPFSIQEKYKQFKGRKISIGILLSSLLRYGSKSTTNPLPYLVMSEKNAQYNGFVRFQAFNGSFGEFELLQPGSYHPYRLNVPWTLHPFYNEATGLFAILETPTIDFVAKRNTSNDLQSQLILSATKPIQFTLNPAAEIDLEKTNIYASLQFDLYQDPQYELETCCATDIEKAFYISDTRLPNTQYENVIETFAPTFSILDVENNGKRTIHTALVPIDKLHEFVFKLEKNHISFLEATSGKPLNMQLNIVADYTFLPNKYNEVNKTLQVYTYHVETNNLTPKGIMELNNNSMNQKIDFDKTSQAYNEDIVLNEAVFSKDTTIVAKNILIVGSLSTANNAQVNIYALENIEVQNGSVSQGINLEIKNLLESEVLTPVSNEVVKAFCNSEKYQARFAANPTLEDDIENTDLLNLNLYPNPSNSALFLEFFIEEDALFSIEVFDIMGKKYTQFASNENVNKGTHKRQFNIESLSNGIYFFKICFDGNCKTEKVLKI